MAARLNGAGDENVRSDLASLRDDLGPCVEGRPCGEMANRVVPDFSGRVPPVAPAEWLSGLGR